MTFLPVRTGRGFGPLRRYRRPRGAFVIVFDRCGRLLVLRRTETHPRYPLHWTLPGGKLDPGETSPQAAQAELFEEAGVWSPVRFLEQRIVCGVRIDYFEAQRHRRIRVRPDAEHDRALLVPPYCLRSLRPLDGILTVGAPIAQRLAHRQ